MFSAGSKRAYKVDAGFAWEIGKKNSGWFLRIPAGTEFESSVPRFFHWFLSPDDQRFLKAACVHDTLLEKGYTRAFADSQWFEVNMSEHTPRIKTLLAYLGMVLYRIGRYGRP